MSRCNVSGERPLSSQIRLFGRDVVHPESGNSAPAPKADVSSTASDDRSEDNGRTRLAALECWCLPHACPIRASYNADILFCREP